MNVDTKMQESKTDDRDLLATSQEIELVRAMGMQYRKQSRLFCDEMHKAQVSERQKSQQLQEITADRDRLLKLIEQNNSAETHRVHELHEAQVIARQQSQELEQIKADRDRLFKLIDENNSAQTHGLQEICNHMRKQEKEKSNMQAVIEKQQHDIGIITKEFCQINNKYTNMWLISERKNKVSFTSINNVKALLFNRKHNAAKMNVSLTWKDAETLMHDWHDDWAREWWPLDDALKKATKEN